jgi:uncharacterized protein (TIGR01777 family)
MRILVAGGTGFIGTALVKRLQKSGHTAVILNRSGGDSPTSAESFRWSDQEMPPPTEAWDGIEAVVNLSGEPANGRWTENKKRRLVGSRVGTTTRLIEGMSGLESPPRMLLAASSIGYYGDRGDETLTEDATAGHDFVASIWRDAEVAAMAAERLGVKVARTRFGIVMGHGPAWTRLKLAANLGASGPVGGGRQWWSWVHLDDVTGFIIHALENGLGGAFNVTAPDARRQRDFARTLARAMHRPIQIPAPGFAVKAILGGFAVELLASRHVIPAATIASGYEFESPDLEPALKGLLAE